MHKQFRIFILIITGCLSTNAFSQADTIRTEDIEVVKEYTPFLEEGKKQSFSPTMPAVEPTDRSNLTYTVPSQFIETSYEPDQIKPLPIDLQDVTTQSTVYLKAGYGNKSNPLAQFALSTAEEANYSIGLLGDYNSLTGDQFDDQKMANIAVTAFGTKEFTNSSFDANVHYNQQNDWLYGYDHSLFDLTDDEVKQTYNTIGATAGLQSIDRDDYSFQYDVRGTVDVLNGNLFENKETQGDVEADFKQQIFDDLAAGLEASVAARKTTISTDDLSGSVLNIRPTIQPTLNNVELEAGVTLSHEKQTDFSLFPHVQAQIPFLNNEYIFFAGWKGEAKMNGLQQVTAINPRIAETVLPQNYTEQVITPAGLKGSFSENASFTASISNTITKNASLFVVQQDEILEPTSGSRFEILQEEKLSDWTPSFMLNYQYGDNVNAVADVKYHFYSTETFQEAYHLPKFETNIDIGFEPVEQLTINGGIDALSGIQTFSENGSDTLDGIFNVDVGAEYLINDQFGVFLDINNLANQEYERWKNYPTVGMNIVGGIVFSY